MARSSKEKTRVDQAVRLFQHGKGALGSAAVIDTKLGPILAKFSTAEMVEYVKRTS